MERCGSLNVAIHHREKKRGVSIYISLLHVLHDFRVPATRVTQMR
jgi:hypothetical protein